MKDILIIGGGAAGIAAAIRAAQTNPHARVTIAEGLEQPGKKLLVTGNGRCNLTNLDIRPAHYHSSQPDALATLLESMPAARTMDFFASLGLLLDEEEGRVYPYSHQAASVRETLLFALEQCGVVVRGRCRVRAVRFESERFAVQTDTGILYADAVILTAGGKAAPKQGTDGTSFALAKRLGHHWAPLFPALTAIKCAKPVCKQLKGVRTRGKLTLHKQGTVYGTDYGELQFTDFGISGIPAFQLSCLLGANPRGFALSVDLLPQLDDMPQQLHRRIACAPDAPIGRCLSGWLHSRLLGAALQQAQQDAGTRAGALSEQDIRRLSDVLKAWQFPVTGVLAWDKAQATGGGVLLEEIDARFASRVCPGLYLAGEILDVVGDCGGYNLHWAWCSGMTAGESAARSLL